MAKIKTKGTKLQQDIATVFTDIAQVISLDLPEAENETYDADTLDNANAGILKEPTFRTEPGSASAELFFDPALVGHQNLTALLTTPVKENWKIIFADAGATVWAFTTAGISLGGTVALNDGLKATLGLTLADLVTYP